MHTSPIWRIPVAVALILHPPEVGVTSDETGPGRETNRSEPRPVRAAAHDAQEPTFSTSPGWGTIRMYGFGDSYSPKISFACSSETEPAMITSSPGCHCAGVCTLCFVVSWGELMTRTTSSKLRPPING